MANFVSYNNAEDILQAYADAINEQQVELKLFCDSLSQRNCQVMLSNSDSKDQNDVCYFEELYKGYDFSRLLAPRFINANPERRNELEEIVIRNYNR